MHWKNAEAGDEKPRSHSPEHTLRVCGWIAAALLLLCGCGGDESEAAAQRCDPAAPACPSGLICAEQGGGEALCQIPPGAACDPAAELVNCRVDSTCTANLEEGDPAPVCLVDEGGRCDPLAPFCQAPWSCAEIEGGEHRCHLPVLVQGMVSDAADPSHGL